MNHIAFGKIQKVSCRIVFAGVYASMFVIGMNIFPPTLSHTPTRLHNCPFRFWMHQCLPAVFT